MFIFTTCTRKNNAQADYIKMIRQVPQLSRVLCKLNAGLRSSPLARAQQHSLETTEPSVQRKTRGLEGTQCTVPHRCDFCVTQPTGLQSTAAPLCAVLKLSVYQHCAETAPTSNSQDPRFS